MRCNFLRCWPVLLLLLSWQTNSAALEQHFGPPLPFFPTTSCVRLPKTLNVADERRSGSQTQAEIRAQETWKLLAGALSGAIAGSVTQLFLHPIDTIKTRLQVRGLNALRLSPSNFRELYAGVTSNVLGEAPSSALFYATYQSILTRALPKVEEDKRSLVHLSAAAVASVASSVIRVPSEVVKTQLQTGRTTGTRKTVLRILQAPSGWRGLFAGYRPFLMRDVPFDALQFMVYELVRQQYIRGVCAPGAREPTRGEDAVLGAFAGGVAGAVTTPFDVIRAELMVSGLGGSAGAGYSRMGEVVVDIVRQEGARGLMRGVWARVGWLAAGGCIFFPALEGSKKLLRAGEPEDSSGPRGRQASI